MRYLGILITHHSTAYIGLEIYMELADLQRISNDEWRLVPPFTRLLPLKLTCYAAHAATPGLPVGDRDHFCSSSTCLIRCRNVCP